MSSNQIPKALKIIYNGNGSRVLFPKVETKKPFAVICDIIKEKYSLENFVLRYKDDEGENCVIQSEDEMAEAIRICIADAARNKKPEEVLKVTLDRLSDTHVAGICDSSFCQEQRCRDSYKQKKAEFFQMNTSINPLEDDSDDEKSFVNVDHVDEKKQKETEEKEKIEKEKREKIEKEKQEQEKIEKEKQEKDRREKQEKEKQEKEKQEKEKQEKEKQEKEAKEKQEKQEKEKQEKEKEKKTRKKRSKKKEAKEKFEKERKEKQDKQEKELKELKEKTRERET